MTERTSIIAALGAFAVILAAIPSFIRPSVSHDVERTFIAVALIGPNDEKRTLTVEIADEQAEQAYGLMHRTDLPPGEGMLFAFSAQRPLSFWMKNTLIPLDILFFDARGRFVSRTSMEPCIGEDPCPMYESGAPALFALEVGRGEALAADVGDGWLLAAESDRN